LYKFLWNKHYGAPKAVERIRREIINTKVSHGGFGMLDIAALDRGIKHRSIGRMITTTHPFLALIRRKTNINNFFKPSTRQAAEMITVEAIKHLGEDRLKLLENPAVTSLSKFIGILKASNIKDILSGPGKQSIEYFRLVRANRTLIGDLDQPSYARLRVHIDRRFDTVVRQNLGVNVPRIDEADMYLYWTGKLRHLTAISAKEFRDAKSSEIPIGIFKSGAVLRPLETLSWGLKLRKITSVKHRNLLLKLAHGDLYTNERLCRFGLRDDPNCERCGMVETLAHKLIECEYSSNIWSELEVVTETRFIDPQNKIESILGMGKEATFPLITILAETLQIICHQKLELPARRIIKIVLERLNKREKGETKNFIENALANF
jgi:hypothetical protein